MHFSSPADLTLLNAVALLSPQSSKNTLRSWIKEGRVMVDNSIVRNANFNVLAGQQVCVGQRKKFINHGIQILYEDADLVLIDKPSGLLSVSAAYEEEETAHSILKGHFRSKKVFVVHRLDQDTSGVMVFAFNQATFDALKELFSVHDIKRSYTAVVEGKVVAPAGVWQSYLYEDEQYVVHETDDSSKGKEAITYFQTQSANKRYSVLRLTLKTGRKNQIRVHCQSAGHSVVGDKKYGAHGNPLKRLGLHAHLLSFKHPTTKKELQAESSVPEEFYKLIQPVKPA